MRAKMTEEERKEAIRLSQAKWRAKNRDYQTKYHAENKEASKERKAKWYANKKTRFVVYTHTNSKGQIYIGSGNSLRPYHFYGNQRSREWHEAFDNDCQVTILTKYKDKYSAKELESYLIKENRGDNLINKYK